MNITVLGYGIQGRAQSLNLRDSGHEITVGNINDKYLKIAIDDQMNTLSIKEASKNADVIFVLLPDAIQNKILKDEVFPNIKKDACLVFAHGFWLTYEAKNEDIDIDMLMIAPRYPGEQIRKLFLDGHGVPAYVDVANDKSGNAHHILKEMTKGLGFDKGGLINLPFKMETEIDLMIEQCMAPIFFSSVQAVFKELISRGYPAEAVIMELYYSGETGAVRTMMARDGLYEAFQNNASPTCQYGVASSISRVWDEKMNDVVKAQIDRIVSGDFSKELKTKNTKSIVNNFIKSPIAKKIKETEKKINKMVSKK